MTPAQLLHHTDAGTLWPTADIEGFADLPTAYATALAVSALRVARGEVPRGYKVGFTNRNIWPRYGVHAPIWGSMWSTTVIDGEGGAGVPLARLCQPRIEPEAVFGFRSTPPANASLDDLYACLEWVAPGFEIVQTHLADWKFVAAQAVADGALHGRLVIGAKVPVGELAGSARALDEVLANARLTLSRDGHAVESGVGSNVLGGPLQALQYFLSELRSCPGTADIRPGEVVTTGTWTDAWPVARGEVWVATFDRALPALTATFA